ncbi:hypothetical protein [Neobacillus cucumis]|uniref:Uncharacterized protein n=1 Tax=Neobacillus cucumis TaxID=1740721 RepID=A0A2N5HRA0_9BACI|nr:hypothetical protein [Neobacillus cucumis]PLS08017.1 hypothetical protein CVD27_04895 [Neobacillus cucumis]
MATTNLPTKSEYEKAVNELKKLNEDIFYGDFKEKINLLESSHKELLDKAVSGIDTVSNEIASFTHELSLSNESNRKFLKQNEAFVTLTSEEIAKTEKRIAAQVSALQQLENRLELLQQSYKEMFYKHSESINSILVVREEALINKVVYQLECATQKQFDQLEQHKLELEELQGKVESMSRHNHDVLHSLSTQMATKGDLAKTEKRSTLKMNLLLGVVVVEAVLIGLQFFM